MEQTKIENLTESFALAMLHPLVILIKRNLQHPYNEKMISK